ncbi:MAG: translocation/assembly module TamB domain-containing protein [Bacteroidia bacterium]|nr:translocation/assembly module TamB domain-containing protein [Bacteroidia bacterium]
MKKYLVFFVRISIIFLSIYLAVFFSAFTLLRFEKIQNYVRPYLVAELEKILNTSIELERIEIYLLNKLALKNLRIKDEQGEILLSAQALKIDILSIPTLLWRAPKNRLKKIRLHTVILENAYFNLYRRQRDEAWNLDFIFRKQEPPLPPDTTPGHKIAIEVKNLELCNLTFRMRDSTFSLEQMQPRLGRLNYTNLHFQNLNLKASLEWKANQQLFLKIQHLSGIELLSGTHLQHFSTFFQATKQKGEPIIRFWSSHFRDAYSNLDFDMELPGLTLDRLFAKYQNRAYQVHFRKSQLDFRSINQFIPAYEEGYVPLAGVVELEGKVKGDYRKIVSSGMVLKYGEATYLQTRFELIDFTRPEMLYLRLYLENSTLTSRDATSLFYEAKLPAIIQKLGVARVNAKFTGFLHDFVANGTFELPAGKIISNINLEYDKYKKAWGYSGNLQTYHLNLDQLLGLKLSKNLNFAGEIQGKDFDLQKTEGEFHFTIRQSDIQGFFIDSVRANVKLKEKKLLANLKIKDKEGNFDGIVELNYQKPRPEFTFLGDVKELDIQHYGISSRPIKVTSIFNIDFEGIHPDSLQGLFRLYRMTLKSPKDSLHLQNISARLENYNNGKKHLWISGQPFDCDIEGIYTFANLEKHLKRLFQNAQRAFQDSLPTVSDSLALGLQFIAHDINPLLNFFELGTTLAPNTQLQAQIELGNTQHFSIQKLIADSLRIRNIFAQNVSVESFELYSHQSKVLGNAYLFCQTLRIAPNFTLANVRFFPRLNNQLLHFSFEAQQPEFKNHYTLNGSTTFLKDTIQATLLANRSEIVLGDTLRWQFLENPQLLIVQNQILLSGFSLATKDQHIHLWADIIKNAHEQGNIQLLPLQLNILKNFLPIEVELNGTINGEIQLLGIFSNMIANANCQLKNFRYGSTLIGDILIQSDWKNEKQELTLQAELIRLGDTLIGLKGTYTPHNVESPLDIYINSKRFPLKILKPWVSELLYELDGYATLHNLHCVGKIDLPKIYGSIELHSTIGFHYFKTPYRFDGTVICQGHQIIFPILNHLKFYSSTQLNARNSRKQEEGYALFSGYVDFSEPTNPLYDIEIHDIRNFLLQTTTASDNPMFYGSILIARGNAKIVGNTQHLIVNARASTAPGTVLNIPISKYSEQERLDFVTFENGIFKNKPTRIERKSTFKISFQLAVEATPEAEFNLIFDEKVGDKITARGKGQLKLIYTPSGEFSMEGLYEITQGDYLFTFRNILNKRFLIESGSKISWNGDPYNAQMDIRALYVVDQANITAWDTTANPINLQVKMNLEGALREPRITFSLEVPSQNTLPYALRNNLRIIESDPQELNRQIFSLLMLNSVAPIGAFFDRYSTQGSVSSSVSEFLSNQLNNWIRQMVDKNLNVSFGFNQQVVMFKLRASLLNNRITIERNGAIASNASRNLSLGNVNIQIKLLPTEKNATADAGLLAIDIFNRENAISNTVASTSRGAGIFYKKEFDTFSDLFHIKKRKIKFDTIALPPKQQRDTISTPPTSPYKKEN